LRSLFVAEVVANDYSYFHVIPFWKSASSAYLAGVLGGIGDTTPVSS
jgi:hypothetical protein